MSYFEKYKERSENDSSDGLFSKAVKAGRRTYFFDVKSTRNDDCYIVITESRKKQGEGDNSKYDKQKLYLYKEDFDKFASGFHESVAFITSYMAHHRPENSSAEEPVAVLTLDEEFELL